MTAEQTTLIEPYAFEGMGRTFVLLSHVGIPYWGFGTMVREDYKLSTQMLDEIKKNFAIKFCKTLIPRSIDVPKLQWEEKPIILYKHPVSERYRALVEELDGKTRST